MNPLLISTVLSLSAIFGAFNCLRYTGVLHKVISFGIAIAVLSLWLDNSSFSSMSLVLQIPIGVLTFVYGQKEPLTFKTEKLAIVIMGLFTATSSLFKINNWPGQNICRLIFILPFTLQVASLLYNKKVSFKELSFMLTLQIQGLYEVYQI